ncbi:hypothetical protein K435DRAFT_842017 [Dendrothele bispora CBS 962.96]|uniref:Uncharacterized protein n=1 Tax=Dendrothele bispora (strain CBS 962.96) TaxID=1314807 RepID=A0A4S8LJV4_DENBC|nr:hypothetical protein K435DRAFT_842017 [Dendrothele bispora CBS 962.96]
MPPTTRSTSANSTPTRSTTRSTTTGTTPTRGKNISPSKLADTSNMSTPTRKTPHCSKCGRPRAGHPRSGCPFVEGGDDNHSVSNSDEEKNAIHERREVDSAAEALESMDLAETRTPRKGISVKTRQNLGRRSLGSDPGTKKVEFDMEDTKEAIRQRHREAREKERARALAMEPSESLASISTSSSELLNLLEFDDDDDEQEKEESKKGIKEMGEGNKRRLSRKMPGTMITPFSSFTSTRTSPPLQEELCTDEEEKDSLQQAPLRPLGRTMSVQEREVFMDDLETLSGDRTKVYVLTDADLLALEGRIPERGIYTHLIDLGKDKKLMIVGRDGKEVNLLHDKMKKKGSGFTSGMMLGAAATFGGLAFA